MSTFARLSVLSCVCVILALAFKEQAYIAACFVILAIKEAHRD